jgi:hypothetical protein
MVAHLKAICATFPDSREGRGGNIAMADFGTRHGIPPNMLLIRKRRPETGCLTANIGRPTMDRDVIFSRPAAAVPADGGRGALGFNSTSRSRPTLI